MEVHAETLKFLLEFGFNAREIASMLSVSIRTIQRRMANFNLREEVPRYTHLWQRFRRNLQRNHFRIS